jgi:hypothetical protein
MTASDMNQVGIQDLFSQAPNYPKWMALRWHVPKGNDPETGQPFPPRIKSFEADEIKEKLFYACSMRGFFSPADRMRPRCLDVAEWLDRLSCGRRALGSAAERAIQGSADRRL